MKVSRDILSLTPYKPGKPISEAKRELGLETVYKLASNENPLGVSPKVWPALEKARGEIHLYPDATAHDMVAAYSQFIHIPPDEVAFGNGSNELIDLLIRIYCEPGDAIATSEAAFIAYKICAQAARVRTLESPLGATGEFDLDALRKKMQSDQRVRLVFIANPNNPTGTYVERQSLESFLEYCSSREVLVVLDEAYIEFVRATDFVSGLELRERFPNLVVLRTMSKAYGLAGLRVGFAIAPVETVDLLHRVRNPFNVSSLAQVATIAALADQAHVKKVCELTWRGLDFLATEFTKLGLTFFPSQGNFLLVDCGQDSEKTFSALLKLGVIIRPVKNYGFPTHLRISVGLEQENQAVISGLKTVLT